MQQSEIIQLNTRLHGDGKPRQVLTPDECLEIYYRAMAACAFFGPFAGACIAAAQVALAASGN